MSHACADEVPWVRAVTLWVVVLTVATCKGLGAFVCVNVCVCVCTCAASAPCDTRCTCNSVYVCESWGAG